MSADDSSKVGALTRFSLDRRITVLVLFLTILVVGVVAAIGIPLELFPRGFEGQSLRVFVPWPDAPTKEVLDKLTLPLEDELSTVRGLDGLSSYSRTGQAAAFLNFKEGTDMDVAYREVRDRVERARTLFPDGVEQVFIRKDDISGIPVAVLGIAVDPSLTDYYNLLQKEIVQPLERIDGVAAVETDGLEEKEIIIEVDREKISAAGLNIYQLAQDLGSDNFSMASGNVRNHGKKYLLRSVATYHSLEDLENRPITKNLHLKDIARIRYEEEDKRFSVRVNSKPAVAVIIFKEGEANTVAVSREIATVIEEMKRNPRLGASDMESLFNQGKAVEESIGSLKNGGKIGGLFAALVLFLFLRRFRLTAIITFSIPLSLLIALAVMFFMGESLNILSILGLVICVGLLVDNSVVVAENIHRMHQTGLSRREACIQGASEIALAVIMATLTTVVVFLPAALVEGKAQFFLFRLALPISVSLIASLLIALVFVPLAVYLTLPQAGAVARDNWFTRAHGTLNTVLRRFYTASFERINHHYSVALAFFLKHRLDLVLLTFGLCGFSFWMAGDNITFVDTQEEDRTSFRIRVEMASEHNFQDTAALFEEAERVLEANREKYNLRGYFVVHVSRSGRIDGWIDRDNPPPLSVKEISEKILAQLPEKAGVKYYLGDENQTKEDEGKEIYVVRLEGEDAESLELLATELEPMFQRVEGVLGLKKSGEQSPNELALVVDRERATASQTNPEFIAGVVGFALRGSTLPRFNDGGRQIPVRIRFKQDDRESLSDLSSFLVPTNQGGALPVSALTESRMLQTSKGVFRRDKKITRRITLELKEEDAKQTRHRLSELSNQLDLPEGISFGGRDTDEGDEDLGNLMFAASLSILFIYLLMGFLFESFILPLSIICTIPLAGIGVIWSHLATGKDLDFLGVVGTLLLVGVVVNNGIVLIDYVNRLRQEGIARSEALLLAAERRFRPIVMTALTTIIGMVPLTVGRPLSMGLSYKSFGLTLIGGMTTATLLTLLVVPVFYTLFDDLRLVFGRALKRIIMGQSRKTAEGTG